MAFEDIERLKEKVDKDPNSKLFIPLARPAIVTRTHLIESLNNGLHCKLTLISAPAGFGKTTLTTEWLNSLRMNSTSMIAIMMYLPIAVQAMVLAAWLIVKGFHTSATEPEPV